MINQFIEEKVKEFKEFMVPEYGVWKIGRIEAKTFLILSLHALLAEIEKAVMRLPAKLNRIETDPEHKYEICRGEVLALLRPSEPKGEEGYTASCPNCEETFETTKAEEGSQAFCPNPVSCARKHPRPVLSPWKKK